MKWRARGGGGDIKTRHTHKKKIFIGHLSRIYRGFIEDLPTFSLLPTCVTNLARVFTSLRNAAVKQIQYTGNTAITCRGGGGMKLENLLNKKKIVEIKIIDLACL